MVAWTDRDPKDPYALPLLGGTRDDRLRTFGDGSTESDLMAQEQLAKCPDCGIEHFADTCCPECEPERYAHELVDQWEKAIEKEADNAR